MEALLNILNDSYVQEQLAVTGALAIIVIAAAVIMVKHYEKNIKRGKCCGTCKTKE